MNFVPNTFMSNTFADVLASGASIRISVDGLTPEMMVKYAATARSGGATVVFVVGNALLTPATLARVSAAGRRSVLFDFVSKC